MNVTLEVGDWSRDGHNQSEKFTFRCNLDRKELIKEAYTKGSKTIGFDLSRQVADEYQDHKLPLEFKQKLLKAGLDYKLDGDEGNTWLSPEDFAHIYLFIAKLGNPQLTYELCDNDYPIHIGGYGLFD